MLTRKGSRTTGQEHQSQFKLLYSLTSLIGQTLYNLIRIIQILSENLDL
jgi:hypothetical protein